MTHTGNRRCFLGERTQNPSWRASCRRLLELEEAHRRLESNVELLQNKLMCNDRGVWLGPESERCECGEGHAPFCKDFVQTTHRFTFTGGVQPWRGAGRARARHLVKSK